MAGIFPGTPCSMLPPPPEPPHQPNPNWLARPTSAAGALEVQDRSFRPLYGCHGTACAMVFSPGDPTPESSETRAPGASFRLLYGGPGEREKGPLGQVRSTHARRNGRTRMSWSAKALQQSYKAARSPGRSSPLPSSQFHPVHYNNPTVGVSGLSTTPQRGSGEYTIRTHRNVPKHSEPERVALMRKGKVGRT